jgi:3-hydroxyisobutyrate dehydrogenase
MANLSFIGLGNLGAPMATNSLRAAHSVRVYDDNAAACAPLVAALGVAAEAGGGAVPGHVEHPAALRPLARG